MELYDLIQKNNGKEKIEHAISKLSSENCVKVFSTYIENSYQNKSLSEYEDGYISALKKGIFDFAKILITNSIDNLDDATVRQKLIDDRVWDGYSFSYYYDNDELEPFINNLEIKAEMKLFLIRKFMCDTLTKYNDDLNKTKKQKEKERLLRELKDCFDSRDSLIKRIEKLETKIAEEFEGV